MKKITLFALAALMLTPIFSWSQGTLTPAQGFNVMTMEDLIIQGGSIGGPIATGNDLIFEGLTSQVTTTSAGHFMVNNTKIGVLVNNQLRSSTSMSTVLNVVNPEAYIKIANSDHVITPGPFAPPPGNWIAWYEDMSGQPAPMRVTFQQHYEFSFPRIELSALSSDFGVSPTVNPIFEGGLYNFNQAFSLFTNRSVSFSQCSSNVNLMDNNGDVVDLANAPPSSVSITLQNGANVLNISAQHLSMISQIHFVNEPNAQRYLIVNVFTQGAGVSGFWNQSGISSSSSPYVLYNFGSINTINLSGATVHGTLLAPEAFLTASNCTIHGQIISKNAFIGGASSIHYQPFAAQTSGCATTPPNLAGVAPTADFDLSASNVCPKTEVEFSNTTVVEGCPIYEAILHTNYSNALNEFDNLLLTVKTSYGDGSQFDPIPEVFISAFDNSQVYLMGQSNINQNLPQTFSLVYNPNASGDNKLIYTITWFGIPREFKLDIDAININQPINTILLQPISMSSSTFSSISNLALNGIPYANTLTSTFGVYEQLVFKGSAALNNGFTLTGSFTFNWQSSTSPIDPSFEIYLGNSTCNSQQVNQPGHPVTYEWVFHDGSTSNLENPTMNYNDPGSYPVILNATNTFGTSSITKFVNVAAPHALQVVHNSVVNTNGSTDFTWEVQPIIGVDFSSFTWTLPDGSTQSGSQASFTFTQAGVYPVSLQAVESISGCISSWSDDFVVTSSAVNTGNQGGIESESLGDALSKVMLKRKLQSLPTELELTDEIKFTKTSVGGNHLVMRMAAGLSLMQMFPSELFPGDRSYVTSPTDILDFTIAEEVLSVDYQWENRTKGVVLGVRTSNRVYNHTKASCDRLRGAEILKVSTIEIEGYQFLIQALRQRNDVVEHAISFAIGQKNTLPHYTLQTNWYVNTYQPAEQMFNFQVWTVSPEHTIKLVKDILNNLTDSKPVVQLDNPMVPTTYVSKVWRGNTEMYLRLHSSQVNDLIEITLDEIHSETQGYATRHINTYSEYIKEVIVDVHDYYEYDGLVRVNGEVTDAFYYADGNWGLDFVSRNTRIQNYQVTNTLNRVYDEDDFLIHRNVEVEANTRDYLILYKSLQPGYIPTDLTDYNYLSFTATGSGMLELGLIKQSIVQWPQQYKANINIRSNENTYYIPLKVFSSTGSKERITADDLTTLTFSFLPALAKSSNLRLNISDLKFTKTAPTGFEYLVHDLENQMLLYPNPSKGLVKCLAYADVSGQATLEVRNLTGAVIYRQNISLVEGRNELSFDFDARVTNSKFVFINLVSSEKDYGTVKVIFE